MLIVLWAFLTVGAIVWMLVAMGYDIGPYGAYEGPFAQRAVESYRPRAMRNNALPKGEHGYKS